MKKILSATDLKILAIIAMTVDHTAFLLVDQHSLLYYFMRLFRAQTGYSVYGYILQNRLIRAAKNIRGGMPVGEAALDSGFSDYSAFYRAFRKQFGASPGRIRSAPEELSGAVTIRTRESDG